MTCKQYCSSLKLKFRGGLTATYRRHNRSLGRGNSRLSSLCRVFCQIYSSVAAGKFQAKKQFCSYNWNCGWNQSPVGVFTWNWKQQAVLGRECPRIQSCHTHSTNRTPLASSTPWEGSAHHHCHEQPEFLRDFISDMLSSRHDVFSSHLWFDFKLTVIMTLFLNIRGDMKTQNMS